MTALRGARTHGEDWETISIPAVTAAPLTDGGAVASADDLTAAGGGASGLSPSDRPSLWELLTDTSDELPLRSPMTLLVEKLEESPAFRRGQVAGALVELQRALETVSHTCNGDEALSLQVGTVTVLAQALLRHQP